MHIYEFDGFTAIFYDKWNLWDLNLLSTIKLNGQSGQKFILLISTYFYLHASHGTQIRTAHDKLFIRLFIKDHFTFDWPTAKNEAKRLHRRFGVIKCLKYNFYDQNEMERLEVGAICSRKKIREFFVSGSEKLIMGL